MFDLSYIREMLEPTRLAARLSRYAALIRRRELVAHAIERRRDDAPLAIIQTGAESAAPSAECSAADDDDGGDADPDADSALARAAILGALLSTSFVGGAA